MNKLSSSIVIIMLLLACGTTNEVTPGQHTAKATPTRAKNVILLVGDGMGLGHITAGMYMNGNKLHLERFPVIGLSKTHASDHLITDSAAGATAFACGVKTYNGAIAVDPDTVSLKTILEEAEELGLATGLVATSTIVHATPASFISHVKARSMYEEIAEQFLNTEVDLFIGGGKKYFDRRVKDDRNIYEELSQKGYIVSNFIEEDLRDINIPKGRNFAYFTADESPLPISQGRDYLNPATTKALNHLDNENGFFLLIEGSQIDWGGHANDTDYLVSEMIDFDNAIGKVLDFAEKDGETLVVVTADHECGGFTINYESKMDSLVTKFTTTGHTGTMVPVFAYGPGAENFSGIYDNTRIYHKMKKAYSWEKENNYK